MCCRNALKEFSLSITLSAMPSGCDLDIPCLDSECPLRRVGPKNRVLESRITYTDTVGLLSFGSAPNEPEVRVVQSNAAIVCMSWSTGEVGNMSSRVQWASPVVLRLKTITPWP